MKQDIRVELTSAKKPKPTPMTSRSAEFSQTICLSWITTPIKAGTIRELSLISPSQWILRLWFIITGKPFSKGLKRT